MTTRNHTERGALAATTLMLLGTKLGRGMCAVVCLLLFAVSWVTVHAEIIAAPEPTPPLLAVVLATIGAGMVISVGLAVIVGLVVLVRWVSEG